jgi:hypothetical protein
MLDVTDDVEEAVAILTRAGERRPSDAPGGGESPATGTQPD